MADENKMPDDLDLDSLAEFGDEAAVTIDEEEVVLEEDLDGFASGFPSWDLKPPIK